MRIFKNIAKILIFSLFALIISTPLPTLAQTSSYPCAPGTAGDWSYCGGSFGYTWSDGPLGDATPTYSDTTYLVTIPAITWVLFGGFVGTAGTSGTVSASTTTYWFINGNDGSWTTGTTDTPPTSSYELGYTMVSDTTGISSVTVATSAELTVATYAISIGAPNNTGEVTCSLSAATSCTATVTATNGAYCTANINSTDTTVSGAINSPEVSDITSSTLTITLSVPSSATGTLAANYFCPQ